MDCLASDDLAQFIFVEGPRQMNFIKLGLHLSVSLEGPFPSDCTSSVMKVSKLFVGAGGMYNPEPNLVHIYMNKGNKRR